jgi:hypothetical protein
MLTPGLTFILTSDVVIYSSVILAAKAANYSGNRIASQGKQEDIGRMEAEG